MIASRWPKFLANLFNSLNTFWISGGPRNCKRWSNLPASSAAANSPMSRIGRTSCLEIGQESNTQIKATKPNALVVICKISNNTASTISFCAPKKSNPLWSASGSLAPSMVLLAVLYQPALRWCSEMGGVLESSGSTERSDPLDAYVFSFNSPTILGLSIAR